MIRAILVGPVPTGHIGKGRHWPVGTGPTPIRNSGFQSDTKEKTMNDERLTLFHNLVNLAAVDHKFTEEEIAFLVNRAEAWNISTDEFETALAGISEGQIEVNIPEDHKQRVSMLKEMIRLMAVDGEMAETEKRLCANASAQMDFTGVQFSEILEEVIRERK